VGMTFPLRRHRPIGLLPPRNPRFVVVLLVVLVGVVVLIEMRGLVNGVRDNHAFVSLVNRRRRPPPQQSQFVSFVSNHLFQRPTTTTTTLRTPSSVVVYLAGSARQRQRHRTSSSSSSSSKEDEDSLQWEQFDFGDSPKWDKRFSNLEEKTTTTTREEEPRFAEKESDYQTWQTHETQLDRQVRDQMQKEYQAWEQVSLDLIHQATAILAPYVNEQRQERIHQVLEQRTQRTRFLFENPANPSNVWACLRTLDSFGIQHVDVVLTSDKYVGKAALSQKRGMRTAMGSAQWLTLRNHPSTHNAITTIRNQHHPNNNNNIKDDGGGGKCWILASDVNPQAQDIRTIDWSQFAKEDTICIVMGNEETGISPEMRQLADQTFYLPMMGFAESFNLSSATAITLAYLSAASSTTVSSPTTGTIDEPTAHKLGPLCPGDLSSREYDCLFFKGLLHSLPKKKLAHALLKREGITLPPEIALL